MSVDAGPRGPGRRPSIKGEEFLHESANALVGASQTDENAGSGRPDAGRVFGRACRDELIDAGKVAVYRTKRDISSRCNGGPARAQDPLLRAESDCRVHDPPASVGLRA